MPATKSRTKTSRVAQPAPTIRSFLLAIVCWAARAEANELHFNAGGKVKDGEIVDDRRVEEQAIEPVEQAAVAGQDAGRVLRARAALQGALCQIAHDAEHVQKGRQRQRRPETQLAEEQEVRRRRRQQARRQAAGRALPRLAGTDRG